MRSTVRLLFFSQFGICTEYNPSTSTVGLFSLCRPVRSPSHLTPVLTNPTITHWYGWTIFVIYYWVAWIDFSSVWNVLWCVNSASVRFLSVKTAPGPMTGAPIWPGMLVLMVPAWNNGIINDFPFFKFLNDRRRNTLPRRSVKENESTQTTHNYIEMP